VIELSGNAGWFQFFWSWQYVQNLQQLNCSDFFSSSVLEPSETDEGNCIRRRIYLLAHRKSPLL